MPQPTRLVSCRLELAVSFVRTWLRRACESLVGPLAPALRHRIGGLVRHRRAGAPSAACRAVIPGSGPDRGADQGLTGATRRASRHAAAHTNRPTEVIMGDEEMDTSGTVTGVASQGKDSK